MVLTKSGLGAALLGGVLALLHLSPGYVTARLIAGDGASVPWLGTTAEVILLSQGLLNAAAFIAGFGALFVLGYWAGLRLELQQHYRQFLLTVGLGGLIGYVTPILLLAVYALIVGGGPLQGEQIGAGATAMLVVGRAVSVAIQFAVVGFAGAAFAGLTTKTRRSDTTTSQPIE